MNILIVSHYFPPGNSIAALRPYSWAKYWSRMGHQVTVAENGRIALDLITASRFDLVLMDIKMPEMNGDEALAGLRAFESAKGGHLPVIALTAYALNGDKSRYLEAGFDG